MTQWSVVTIPLLISSTSLAEEPANLRHDVCSQIPIEQLAPLIGGGAIVSTVVEDTSFSIECEYQHPEGEDGRVPPGRADLDILLESSDAASSRFERDIQETVKTVREGSGPQILLVEMGKDYLAWSDEVQARAVHAGRFVILTVSPPGAVIRTRKSSNAIRALAIHAAGAAPDPNAQVSPPAGLPRRVQWTTFDESYAPLIAHALPIVIPLGLIVLILWFTLLPYRRRQRILATGLPATAIVKEVSLTGTRINNNPVLRVKVLIEPPNGSPYLAEGRKVFAITSAPFVEPGLRLNIKIDPKRPDRFEVASVPSGVQNAR